ncbi:hypothetical protein [Acutalibacter sp. JLR.KK004]|uniref:hypothetical protein n=1 Tax=Acutalibacter sp. JLR.KK004 TaxID=3112622 RepID=UPI002FF31591
MHGQFFSGSGRPIPFAQFACTYTTYSIHQSSRFFNKNLLAGCSGPDFPLLSFFRERDAALFEAAALVLEMSLYINKNNKKSLAKKRKTV